MKSNLRRRTLWIALNAIGIAVYLKLGSALWVVPGEEGTPGGPGDAFSWLFPLAPILAAFLILNPLALFAIVRGRSATRTLVAVAVWLLAATVAMDHQRSVRQIDAQFT